MTRTKTATLIVTKTGTMTVEFEMTERVTLAVTVTV